LSVCACFGLSNVTTAQVLSQNNIRLFTRVLLFLFRR
jgi:hypothetical protein